MEQKEKITRFLNDKAMEQAVFDVLLKSFIKPQERKELHVIAAERIAIDLLHDAWKDLQKIRNETTSKPKELKQVGM